MESSMSDEQPKQLQKFKDIAREIGCDENEARWDKRLKKVAEPKSETKKPAD